MPRPQYQLVILSLVILSGYAARAQTLSFDVGGRSEPGGPRAYTNLFGNAGMGMATGTVSASVGGEAFSATFVLSVSSSDANPVIAYRVSSNGNNFIGVSSANNGQGVHSTYGDGVSIAYTGINHSNVVFDGFTKLTGGNAASTERATVNGVLNVGGLQNGSQVDLTASPYNYPKTLAVQSTANTSGGTSTFDIAEVGLQFSWFDAGDTTAPAMPSNLVARASNSYVRLEWSANTEPDLEAYTVSRQLGTGPFVVVGKVVPPQAHLVDYGFSTHRDHRYRLTAVDHVGNVSDPAELVVLAATPPGTLDFSPTDAADRPHIILVMADDQGWGDTGYNGHPVLRTPVMDEMAASGFVLNRFYAGSPVCSPTRASVLSGRHAMRSKVTNHGRYMRSHQEMTLPGALQSAGYVTGLFGKAHVGSGQVGSPVNPGGMGFDQWLIGLNYFDNSPFLSRNGIVEHRAGEQGSVVVADETIAFLDAHKDSGQPMFAVVWFPSPHNPHAEVSSDPTLYNGMSDQGYFQEITLLDEQLGRIREWLRIHQLHENTLLWYCSDNGGLRGESSGGRGKKGSTWEGGVRIPGIIEWPVRNLTGSCNVPAVTSDMYPTLLALTGITLPDQLPLDGIDLRGIIEGSSTNRPGFGSWHGFQGGQSTASDTLLSDILAKQQNGDPLPHNASRMLKDVDAFPQFAESLSTGNAAWTDWPWKLHRRGGTDYQLYHLENDPLEAADLAGDPAQAGRLSTLQTALHAWQASVMRSLNGADYGQVPAWMPFNTVEGLEALDADGSSRGTVEHVADTRTHWVAGRHNRGLALDGIDDVLRVGNAHLYPPVGAAARSVTTWIKTASEGVLFRWGDPTIDGGLWQLAINAAGLLEVDVGAGRLSGQSDLRDNTWHHVAIVLARDGTPDVTDTVLYVDGVAEGPGASTAQSIRTSNSDMILGGARAGGVVLDEFRLFPRALAADDVQAEFLADDRAAASWLYRYFGHEGPGTWHADSDGDGQVELAEYAFGLDPRRPDAAQAKPLAWINPVTRKLELTFTRRKAGTHDLHYATDVSHDFSQWFPEHTVKLVRDHPWLDPGAFEQVIIQSDETHDDLVRLYLRLTVEKW